MKAFSLLTLLAILFTANYVLAQDCPCDTAQLSGGLTGADIVNILCPGGIISQGNIWVLNPDVIAISGDVGNGSGAAYDVLPNIKQCEITDFVNSTVVLPLTEQQVEICSERLIRGCSLLVANKVNIPTLSEWGMIATAGILGVIGLFVAVRRRKAAA